MSENSANAETREVSKENDNTSLLNDRLEAVNKEGNSIAASTIAIMNENESGEAEICLNYLEDNPEIKFGHNVLIRDPKNSVRQLLLANADPNGARLETEHQLQEEVDEKEKEGDDNEDETNETMPLSRFTVHPMPANHHPPSNGSVTTVPDDVGIAKQLPEDIDETDYLEDSVCGIGPFRPAWLQRLASTKAYVLVYGLIGMCQFGLGSYFVATITTTEKRFKIPSWTSGNFETRS